MKLNIADLSAPGHHSTKRRKFNDFDMTKDFEKRLKTKENFKSNELLEKKKNLDELSLDKLEDIYRKDTAQKEEENTLDIYTKILIEGTE